MASLARGKRLVKLMTPELVSKALAEWLLVQGGHNVDSHVTVTTQFSFDKGAKTFTDCRVEIELL
jgi:hypothetical protein